jgi:hypothetical protein
MDYVARHYYMDLPLCAFAPLNLFFHNIWLPQVSI